MVRFGDTQELEELLRRLKRLNEKFPQETEKSSKGTDQNDFGELEDTFLRRSQNVQTMLKQMGANSSSDTKSITEQIRNKRNVQQELQAMGECMKKMHQLIEKEKRKKVKKKGKLTDEEMQRREANMKTFAVVFQKIQTQLVGERAAFGASASVQRSEVTREQLFGSSFSGDIEKGGKMGTGFSIMSSVAAKKAGIGMGGGFGSSTGGDNLSKEQTQQLEEIKMRDSEQDQIIEEIGQLILEAGQIAEAIHQTVEKQNIQLAEVEKNIDTVQDNMTTVNVRLRKSLEASGMSWTRVCCIFLCMMVILGLVGVIVTQLL